MWLTSKPWFLIIKHTLTKTFMFINVISSLRKILQFKSFINFHTVLCDIKSINTILGYVLNLKKYL